MAIIDVEGLKFRDGLASHCIVVENSKIDEYIDYINRFDVKCVTINDLHCYKKDEIGFLERCPNVEEIYINSLILKNFSGLYSLKKIKKLISDEPGGELDLSLLHQLEELSIGWNKNIKGLSQCKNLRVLRLRKYKPKKNNLEELSVLSKIEELVLTQVPLSSLKGCGEFGNLKKLELNYISKLELIDEIEKNAETLKSLWFESCKRIKDHEYVTCLKELEVLAFVNCGEIPSIGFISKFPKLKRFIFVNTNIVDGDLSPCIGLEYVGFLDKKHYSHKSSFFEKNG